MNCIEQGVATVAQLAEFDEIIDVALARRISPKTICRRAINCPVLDDEERARVGTLYKQVSPFDAKKLGAALVAQQHRRATSSSASSTSRATGGRWSIAGAAASAAAP